LFPLFAADFVDAGGKFCHSSAGVFDTGGKFVTGLVDKSCEFAISGAP
jgi:hypothetical protein